MYSRISNHNVNIFQLEKDVYDICNLYKRRSFRIDIKDWIQTRTYENKKSLNLIPSKYHAAYFEKVVYRLMERSIQ